MSQAAATSTSTAVAPTTTSPPPPPRLWFTSQPSFSGPLTVLSMAAGGGDERSEPAAPARTDQLSPDGAHVVLDRIESSTFEGCGFAGCSSSTSTSGSILVLRADGSDKRVLTQGGTDHSPRWSPTADLIAYVSHRRQGEGEFDVIAFIRSDGKELGGIPNPPGGIVGVPAFSPDGRRLAYVHGQINAAKDGNDWELRVYDIASRSERVLLRQHLEHLSWSPDGARLAAVAVGDTPDKPRSLVTVPLDGTGPRTLFRVVARTSPGLLYVCGSTVNEFPLVVDPTWSPDGTQIAFAHNAPYLTQENNALDIAVVGSDGEGLHVVRRGGPIRCDLATRHWDRMTVLGWRPKPRGSVPRVTEANFRPPVAPPTELANKS